MRQRALQNAGTNASRNEIRISDRTPCNGGVKMLEFKLQTFPWTIFVLLWSLTAFLAVSVPYLAKSIPPTHRTDIKWWMTGVVYQIPAATADQRHYFTEIVEDLDYLQSLSIQTIRIGDFFKTKDGAVSDYFTPNPVHGNMADFENFMDVLVRRDMRLIIDLPLTHTSDAHAWFVDDIQHRSRDSVYTWKQTSEEDRDDQDNVESYWKKDASRQEYFQHVSSKPTSPLINYATTAARTKMQSVFSYWIQRGVAGFVLLDYDKIVFRPNRQRGTNHIQFEHPKVEQLRYLANLTSCFKKHMTEQEQINDPDDPTDILLALDISWRDENSWTTLYKSGADLVINDDVTMTSDYTITGDINPFELRHQICDDKTRMKQPDNDNSQNLVNMVQLLLPGAAFVCQGQTPNKQVDVSSDTADHFRQLVEWRLTSAMSWGETQLGYVDRSTFSFVRYAFGKMYPRYIIITNFGSHLHRHNFTMVRDGLVVPDTGVLRYFSCPHGSDTLVEDRHIINTIVHLNSTVVHPRCGLLVELQLRPSI